MADKIEEARSAAIGSLVRELGIDLEEAEWWCVAWQEFARRNGGAQSAYFWHAGRGWIDAQRAMDGTVALFERPRFRVVRSSRASVADARRVDRAS